MNALTLLQMSEPDSDAHIPSHQYGEVIVPPVVMLLLTMSTVLLRCLVKKTILKVFYLDDWLLVLSFFLYAILCSLAISSAGYGFGVHTNILPEDDVEMVYRLWYIEEITYLVTTVVLKLSISILLLRLLDQYRALRIVIWCTAIFYTFSSICFIFGVIFQCHPVSAFWTDNDQVLGTCAKTSVLRILCYLQATISLATDFIYTLIPTYIVWTLNMKIDTKISVIIVLCFGFMASSVNMARYAYIDNLASHGDNTFDYFTIGVVSILEVGLGIIATSLATCKPLLQIFPKRLRSIRTWVSSDTLDENSSIHLTPVQKHLKETTISSNINV